MENYWPKERVLFNHFSSFYVKYFSTSLSQDTKIKGEIDIKQHKNIRNSSIKWIHCFFKSIAVSPLHLQMLGIFILLVPLYLLYKSYIKCQYPRKYNHFTGIELLQGPEVGLCKKELTQSAWFDETHSFPHFPKKDLSSGWAFTGS